MSREELVRLEEEYRRVFQKKLELEKQLELVTKKLRELDIRIMNMSKR